MTYHGVKIAALLESHRQSIVHVSTSMLEVELARLGIKFKSKPYGNIIREYELEGIVNEYAHKSGDLKIYADELRLVYQGIISDGKTDVCVEPIRTRDSIISYYSDDIKCTERKDCLIYRPCLMHDTFQPVFLKELFVQNQIVIPLPEPVHIVNASLLLGTAAYFVLLESEAEEFKKLFYSKRSD